MKNNKGFTLVELLIVLVGIGVFTAIIGGVGYVLVHFISKVW
jgi:prepilin-type N-terminal cleavage/methylation domain-containing protein